MKIKWIDAEEIRPKTEQVVLLKCATQYGSYKCIGFYVPPGILRDDSNFCWDYECCNEYDEEHDDYLVNPGWYERIYNWDDYSAVGIMDDVIGWAFLDEEENCNQIVT